MAKNKIYIAEFDAYHSEYIRKLMLVETKTLSTSAKIQKSFAKIQDNWMGITAGIAAFSGVGILLKETVDLAAKTQGVRKAFEKLANSETIFKRLKKSTEGMVSDFVLMQTAVKADNFKIPLDLLSKGLEFANKRALQTGESVEYMVDSFITGVARKSIPILDNLGISQLELNKEIAKTGDFYSAIGVIVERENLKMAGGVDNAAASFAKLNAIAENFKVSIGEGLIPTLNELAGSFTDIANRFDSSGLGGILDKWLKLALIVPRGIVAGVNMGTDLLFGSDSSGSNAGGNSGPVTPYSFNNLVSDQNNAMLSLFNNSKPTTQTGTKGGRAPIPMLNGRLMDNPQRYLEAVLGNAGVRGGDIMDLGLSNIPGMGSIDVPEIKNNFEEIGTSFVDKFGELNGIASQFGNLLGIGADTFVGKMIQGMDTVSQIFGLITSIVNFASGGGPITSLLGLAEGGTVVNKNGKLSYVPIPKFATGGSYMVPPGYANDSGLIRVQSGERVDVTPSGQVPILSKLLSSIDSKLGAANITNSRKGGQPILLSINLDGKKIATSVFGYENNFNKRGVDKTLLRGDSGV